MSSMLLICLKQKTTTRRERVRIYKKDVKVVGGFCERLCCVVAKMEYKFQSKSKGNLESSSK